MTRPQRAERLAAMIAFYRDGHSLEEVGAAFGVSKPRIYQIFRAAGVPVRTKAIADDYAKQKVHGIGGTVERENKTVVSGRAPSQRDTGWRYGQASRAGSVRPWR